MTRTSSNIFRARLEFLVEEQGIERTARFYDRTPQTVRRWLAGDNTPSQRIRESVRRRGLTAGAPQAQQVRTGGRFTAEGTIARGGSLNAVASINRRMRRVRQAEMRRARRTGSERQMRAARMLPTRLTQDEAAAIAIRRERLVAGEPGRVGPSGEIQVGDDIVGEPQDATYWLTGMRIDDWRQWEEDYEAFGFTYAMSRAR